MISIKIIILLLKKHLEEGDSVSSFFKNLVAIITPLEKTKIGTKKDPAEKLTETTIKSYIYRSFPKKYAQQILNVANFSKLTNYINQKKTGVRRALAADLKPYAPNADEKNVGKIAADMLEQALCEAAGHIPTEEAETIRQQETYNNLKKQYGEFIFQETGGMCPNCGKQMYSSAEGKISKIFEIFILDDKKENSPDNLIALCHKCHADLQIKKDKAVIRKLKSAKRMFVSNSTSLNSVDGITIESGLADAIMQISNIKSGDFNGRIVFNPVEIDKKIPKQEDFHLYNKVSSEVSVYFSKVNEIMRNLDKKKQISYEMLQNEIKSIYIKLRDQNLSKTEIFEQISKKIHNSTLKENIYCDIVVSYFVQTCEVFDAAS